MTTKSDTNFITKKDLEKWSQDYIKICKKYYKTTELDNAQKNELMNIIKWARNEDFWKTNFLSPHKLLTKDKNGILYFEIFKLKYNESLKKSGFKTKTQDDIPPDLRG